MDERSGVAVERIGADGGERSGDRIECSLHRLVDRRAPVREPRTTSVLELGMEKALADRARSQVDQRECRARGAAELQVDRGRGGERDQLVEADATRARAVTELRQIRHGRDSDGEIAGRERSVAPAGEHRRADVLLPQDFERCALRNGVDDAGLGCGHEPFRMGQHWMSCGACCMRLVATVSIRCSPSYSLRDQ